MGALAQLLAAQQTPSTANPFAAAAPAPTSSPIEDNRTGTGLFGFLGNFGADAKDLVGGLATMVGTGFSETVHDPLGTLAELASGGVYDDPDVNVVTPRIVPQMLGATVADVKDRYFDGDLPAEIYDHPLSFIFDAAAVAGGAGGIARFAAGEGAVLGRLGTAVLGADKVDAVAQGVAKIRAAQEASGYLEAGTVPRSAAQIAESAPATGEIQSLAALAEQAAAQPAYIRTIERLLPKPTAVADPVSGATVTFQGSRNPLVRTIWGDTARGKYLTRDISEMETRFGQLEAIALDAERTGTPISSSTMNQLESMRNALVRAKEGGATRVATDAYARNVMMKSTVDKVIGKFVVRGLDDRREVDSSLRQIIKDFAPDDPEMAYQILEGLHDGTAAVLDDAELANSVVQMGYPSIEDAARDVVHRSGSYVDMPQDVQASLWAKMQSGEIDTGDVYRYVPNPEFAGVPERTRFEQEFRGAMGGAEIPEAQQDFAMLMFDTMAESLVENGRYMDMNEAYSRMNAAGHDLNVPEAHSPIMPSHITGDTDLPMGRFGDKVEVNELTDQIREVIDSRIRLWERRRPSLEARAQAKLTERIQMVKTAIENPDQAEKIWKQLRKSEFGREMADEVRKAVNDPTIVSRAEGTARGRTLFGQDFSSLIRLYRTGDFTTVAHEASHVLRRYLPDIESDELWNHYRNVAHPDMLVEDMLDSNDLYDIRKNTAGAKSSYTSGTYTVEGGNRSRFAHYDDGETRVKGWASVDTPNGEISEGMFVSVGEAAQATPGSVTGFGETTSGIVDDPKLLRVHRIYQKGEKFYAELDNFTKDVPVEDLIPVPGLSPHELGLTGPIGVGGPLHMSKPSGTPGGRGKLADPAHAALLGKGPIIDPLSGETLRDVPTYKDVDYEPPAGKPTPASIKPQLGDRSNLDPGNYETYHGEKGDVSIGDKVKTEEGSSTVDTIVLQVNRVRHGDQSVLELDPVLALKDGQNVSAAELFGEPVPQAAPKVGDVVQGASENIEYTPPTTFSQVAEQIGKDPIAKAFVDRAATADIDPAKIGTLETVGESPSRLLLKGIGPSDGEAKPLWYVLKKEELNNPEAKVAEIVDQENSNIATYRNKTKPKAPDAPRWAKPGQVDKGKKLPSASYKPEAKPPPTRITKPTKVKAEPVAAAAPTGGGEPPGGGAVRRAQDLHDEYEALSKSRRKGAKEAAAAKFEEWLKARDEAVDQLKPKLTDHPVEDLETHMGRMFNGPMGKHLANSHGLDESDIGALGGHGSFMDLHATAHGIDPADAATVGTDVEYIDGVRAGVDDTGKLEDGFAYKKKGEEGGDEGGTPADPTEPGPENEPGGDKYLSTDYEDEEYNPLDRFDPEDATPPLADDSPLIEAAREAGFEIAYGDDSLPVSTPVGTRVTWTDYPGNQTDVGTVVEINPKSIRLTNEVVAKNAKKYRDGSYLDDPEALMPIIEKRGGKFYVNDGNHRVWGSQQRGDKKLKVILTEGELLHEEFPGMVGGRIPEDHLPAAREVTEEELAARAEVPVDDEMAAEMERVMSGEPEGIDEAGVIDAPGKASNREEEIRAHFADLGEESTNRKIEMENARRKEAGEEPLTSQERAQLRSVQMEQSRRWTEEALAAEAELVRKGIVDETGEVTSAEHAVGATDTGPVEPLGRYAPGQRPDGGPEYKPQDVPTAEDAAAQALAEGQVSRAPEGTATRDQLEAEAIAQGQEAALSPRLAESGAAGEAPPPAPPLGGEPTPAPPIEHKPWTREMEEAFAADFEKWMNNGVIQNRKLLPAFEAMKRSLAKLWNKIRGFANENQLVPDKTQEILDRYMGGVFDQAPAPAQNYAGLPRRRTREVRGAPSLNETVPQIADIAGPVLDSDQAKNAAMMEGVAREMQQPLRRTLQGIFGQNSVVVRVKKMGSIIEKMRAGGQALDALGARVVIDTWQDVESAVAKLQEAGLQVLAADDFRRRPGPGGQRGVRLVVQDAQTPMPFEVEIGTARFQNVRESTAVQQRQFDRLSSKLEQAQAAMEQLQMQGGQESVTKIDSLMQDVENLSSELEAGQRYMEGYYEGLTDEVAGQYGEPVSIPQAREYSDRMRLWVAKNIEQSLFDTGIFDFRYALDRNYLALRLESGAEWVDDAQGGSWMGGKTAFELDDERAALGQPMPVYFPHIRAPGKLSDFILQRRGQGMRKMAENKSHMRNRGELFEEQKLFGDKIITDPFQAYSMRAARAIKMRDTYEMVASVASQFGRRITSADELGPGERLFAPDFAMRFFRMKIGLEDRMASLLQSMGDSDWAEALTNSAKLNRKSGRDDLAKILENGVRSTLGVQDKQAGALALALDEMIPGAQKEILAVSKQNLDLFAIPEVVASRLEKSASSIVPSSVKLFWDTPTNMWRAWTLYGSPRWVLNNVLGNTMFAKLQGTPMWDVLRGFYDKEFRQMADQLASDTEGVLSGGFLQSTAEQYTAKLGTDAATKSGQVIQSGARFMATNPALKPMRSWTDAVKRLNGFIEDRYRVASYIKALKRAGADLAPDDLRINVVRDVARGLFTSKQDLERMLVKGITPEAGQKALAEVDHFFGNFRTMTPVERNVIRRFVMPFYGFYRHVMKLLTSLPFEQPAKFSVMRSLAELGHEIEAENGPMPDWMKGSLVPFGAGSTYLSTAGANPFNVVQDAGLSMLHPFVKVALEQMLGRDVFTQREFTDPDVFTPYGSDQQYRIVRGDNGVPIDAVPVEKVVPSLGVHLLSQIPQYDMARSLASGGRPYDTEGIIGSLGNAVPGSDYGPGNAIARSLGVSTTNYDLQSYQERFAQERENALMQAYERWAEGQMGSTVGAG